MHDFVCTALMEHNCRLHVLTYLLYMNFSYRNIKRVAPANGKAKISLLGDYDPKGVKIIDDPYYVSEKYQIHCLH